MSDPSVREGRTRTAVCPRCKRRVRIYVPAAGDGSVYVYSLHPDPAGEFAHCIESKGMVDEEDADVR